MHPGPYRRAAVQIKLQAMHHAPPQRHIPYALL